MVRLSTYYLSAILALAIGAFTLFSPALAQTPAPSATSATVPSAAPAAATPAAAPAAAPADRPNKPSDVNDGDNAWMLTSCALVLLMTIPGLALFYTGLVRSKNVLSVMMQSFIASGLITVQWFFFGYSLAFGHDAVSSTTSPLHGFIGNLDYAFLQHVSSFSPEGTQKLSYGNTVPHMVYCMFQLMFAIITPALISGAIVERMKFSAYCVFMLLWATFIYDPLAHMVWSHDGWLNAHGALDFAGGSVVHMSSGFSALTLALILGRRKRSDGGEELRPHNLPFTLVGVALLWVGWFGFNSGSAINAGQLATSAWANTHIATATAAVVWLLWDWFIYKKPTALGFGSGAVAGLVAITPACGFVTPVGSVLIGTIVASVCFFAIRLKNLVKADDALDVFGVHGIGGLTGCLCTGLFSVLYINSAAGRNGLLFGGPFAKTMVPQLMDAGMTIIMAVVGTVILAAITKLICGGLRTDDEEEEMGLDLTDHGESGYLLEGAGTGMSPA
ncbi:MAG: ammonium transporter [Capsulimonadaceae bacterium]|nr:ammonium transporter [Capsulimonadaceae bacterium]